MAGVRAVTAQYTGSLNGTWLPSAASASFTVPTDCTVSNDAIHSFEVQLLLNDHGYMFSAIESFSNRFDMAFRMLLCDDTVLIPYGNTEGCSCLLTDLSYADRLHPKA